MKKFVPIPVVESSLYIFGGHMHTVPAAWSFFEQKHQAFELMCILKGEQVTELEGVGTYTYGPGDVMIISPGTVHTNYNASNTDDMTYITFHFNFEGLKLKSEIISRVSDMVVDAEDELAKKSIATAKEIVKYSEEKDLDKEETDLKIQILMLKYLQNLKKYLMKNRLETNHVFSEMELKTAKNMALLIESNVENIENHPFSIGDICDEIGISNGYGYRIFKKIYGITPLHFVEKQKYQKAKLLLGYLEYSIEDVAYMVGASNISMFSKQFKKWSGQTPTMYRKQITKKRKVRSVKQSGYFE
jgi:AraC-like DNA-binding protein